MQTVDLLLSEVVKVLILRKSMHHSPSLLSQLADLIEDGNALVVVDQEANQAESDESPCSADSCAAMHKWHRPLRNTMQEVVNEVVEVFLAFL